MSLFHSKSKKAFEHNVKAEMDAGHPQKQSLAIAYATKRRGAKKKMANGGEARQEPKAPMPGSAAASNDPSFGKTGVKTPEQARKDLLGYANGGQVGEGQPGKKTPEPCSSCYEMHDSEMGCGQPSSVKMAKAQGEADAHAMLDSEMGHFAEGGMADSEMGAGMPGKRIPDPMGADLMAQQRLPGEMNRSPVDRIRMARMQAEAQKHSMEDSEMGHFAEGGMASAMHGNPKLQQAYKSAHEAVMSKHKAKMMADGGDVDIELNAMEEGEDSLGSSPLDKMDRHAAQKENYDEGMHSAFGEDGQDEMHGDSIAERIKRKKSR